MFHTPAHKQTDPRKFPGQIVNPLPSEDVIEATKPLDTFTATGIAEGFIQAKDAEEYFAAWQHLVDTGAVDHLQGWFGRTARRLIEAGHVQGRH